MQLDTSSVNIQIFNRNNITENNNDFALDDISLQRQCSVSETITLNVAAVPSISGSTSICGTGISTTLTGTPVGGTWSSGNPSVATIDPVTGVVTGLSTGTSVITYTTSAGCVGTTIFTINPVPVISGPGTICEGPIGVSTWTTIGGTVGTWSSTGSVSLMSANPAASGTFEGFSAGTGTISFTDGTTGCASSTNVTVDPSPTISTPGPYLICTSYSSLVLAATPSGGVWSTSDPTVATIDAVTGTVYPVGIGTVIMTYTLSDGCYATVTITVVNCTGGGGGGNPLCPGQTETLTLPAGMPAGGIWSSSNPALATVDPVTGVITGVGGTVGGSGGTVVITYTAGVYSYSFTITIYPAETSCVTFVPGTGWVFTTSCPGGALYFDMYDWTGTYLGTVWQPFGGHSSVTVSNYTMNGLCGCSSVTNVCITYLACNSCDYTSTCCANANPTTGIVNTQNNKTGLAIIPNPNNGTFMLTGILSDISGTQEVKLEIVDMLGKTVHNDVATIENGNIDKEITLGSELPNGIYLIKVKNENINQVVRFVLDR